MKLTGVLTVLTLSALAFGCSDGNDLIDLTPGPDAAAVAGCAVNPPVDAGTPDMDCSCPEDGSQIVVNPGCGIICGL
jgi:hypothetical protein